MWFLCLICFLHALLAPVLYQVCSSLLIVDVCCCEAYLLIALHFSPAAAILRQQVVIRLVLHLDDSLDQVSQISTFINSAKLSQNAGGWLF